MNRTLAYSFHKRRVLILAHTKDAPSEPEWNEYVASARQWRPEIRAFLVLSEGGGPNAAQRAALDEAVGLENHPGKTAVVTVSMMARGIVTAIGWFSKGIKAFSTNQISAALDYLEIPKADQDGVLAEIKRLREHLSSGG
jgi:hypothetical protein